MTKYRVQTDSDFSKEYLLLDEAMKIFDNWKDDMMAEGVYADETYIELVESDDDFESEKVVKRLVAVVDHERTELRTPEEEGMPQFDYWAKWIDVTGNMKIIGK